MADTKILFVMINLTQSLQWESSWIVSDKIAFHSQLNFPAIFLFFWLYNSDLIGLVVLAPKYTEHVNAYYARLFKVYFLIYYEIDIYR